MNKEAIKKINESKSAIDRLDILVAWAANLMNESAEDDKTYQYKFKTASFGLVSLPELCADVTRKHPVLEVVLEGKEHNSFHYLLVHDSVVLKAKMLSAMLPKQRNKKAQALRINTFLNSLTQCTDTAHFMDISKNEGQDNYTLRDALKVINEIRDFVLASLGVEKCTVIVRSR